MNGESGSFIIRRWAGSERVAGGSAGRLSFGIIRKALIGSCGENYDYDPGWEGHGPGG